MTIASGDSKTGNADISSSEIEIATGQLIELRISSIGNAPNEGGNDLTISLV
jgi:hypothetical protein